MAGETRPPPGSRAALLALVERISRLASCQGVVEVLLRMDAEQLQHRAEEATSALGLQDEEGEAALAQAPLEASLPCLCALGVECVKVVERAELSTHLARVVAAGCELLAELWDPRTSDARGSWSYNWLEETLEDLSDELDFLALEVYCGLGRLEGAVAESDSLPVVAEPDFDDFGSFWGSIEHRQALQELSAWLLCLVFRALSYGAISARNLMEFTNRDLLCLCSLMRGLLAARPGCDDGLPHDTAELQGVALHALCGLTAPELAFPVGQEDCEEDDLHPRDDDSISTRNRTLGYYLEVLCAAVVETGLLQNAMDAVLFAVRASDAAHGGTLGVRFLSFLSALMLQADVADREVVEDDIDEPQPALRLRAEVAKRADALGVVLEAILGGGVALQTVAQLRELAVACASLSAALAAVEGSGGPCEDGFTLACRMMLTTCLDHELPQGRDGAVVLAALAALAVNVGDFEVCSDKLRELAGRLPSEDVSRARARLLRTDCMRILVRGGAGVALAVFPKDAAPPPPSLPPPAAVPGAAPPAPCVPGLRDLVRGAPWELRCALDGKLLCDPVVSPEGVVFERSTLARWLQTHPPQCPVTGQPLSLATCQRSLEIRRKVTEWVRGAGKRKGRDA